MRSLITNTPQRMGLNRMSNTVRSVEKAFEILDCITDEALPCQTLGNIASHLGKPKSTIHQLLQSLCKCAMVEEDPAAHTYHLGHKALQLAATYLRQLDLVDIARTHLKALQIRSGETVVLAKRMGDTRVNVAVSETHNEVRWSPVVGSSYSLIAGVTSLVILAFLPEGERSEMLIRFSISPADRRELEQRLSEIHRHGFGWSFSGRVKDFNAVAAPLWNWRNEVQGALTIAGPSSRFPSSTQNFYEGILREVANAISNRCGATMTMK